MSISNKQKLEQRYKIYERIDGKLSTPVAPYDRDIYEYDGYDSHDDAFNAIQKYADENGYAGIRDLIIVAEVGWTWKEGIENSSETL